MDQYAKSFTKPSIRIGTITVLLAMLGSFFPNIYLYLAHGVWPDASHMFSAWGSVAMAFGAFYLVEPISYFPVFGPTGTYIGILSGNISQIRLPAASTAQDVLGVEPSSHKGEVVGILAICGSVVTNILFLTVAVVAGSTLLAFLPESVTSAMANYILPSLFGAHGHHPAPAWCSGLDHHRLLHLRHHSHHLLPLQEETDQITFAG